MSRVSPWIFLIGWFCAALVFVFLILVIPLPAPSQIVNLNPMSGVFVGWLYLILVGASFGALSAFWRVILHSTRAVYEVFYIFIIVLVSPIHIIVILLIIMGIGVFVWPYNLVFFTTTGSFAAVLTALMRKYLTISDTHPQSTYVVENVSADSKTSDAITEVSEQAKQLSGFEWIGSTQEKLGPSFFLLCILFVALFNYVPSVQILALLAFVFISSLFKRASPVSTLVWIQMSHTLYPMMLFPMVNSPVFYLLPISLTCWEFYYQWFKLRSSIISFLRVRCPDSVLVHMNITKQVELGSGGRIFELVQHLDKTLFSALDARGDIEIQTVFNYCAPASLCTQAAGFGAAKIWLQTTRLFITTACSVASSIVFIFMIVILLRTPLGHNNSQYLPYNRYNDEQISNALIYSLLSIAVTIICFFSVVWVMYHNFSVCFQERLMSLTSTKYTMTKAVGPLTVVTAQVHPISVSSELPTFDDCFNPLTVSHAYVAQNPMAIGALMMNVFGMIISFLLPHLVGNLVLKS